MPIQDVCVPDTCPESRFTPRQFSTLGPSELPKDDPPHASDVLRKATEWLDGFVVVISAACSIAHDGISRRPMITCPIAISLQSYRLIQLPGICLHRWTTLRTVPLLA